MAGTGWTEGETQALLHVWSDQSVQLKLKAVSKNRTIYEAIARSLTDMGYVKTGGVAVQDQDQELDCEVQKS